MYVIVWVWVISSQQKEKNYQDSLHSRRSAESYKKHDKWGLPAYKTRKKLLRTGKRPAREQILKNESTKQIPFPLDFLVLSKLTWEAGEGQGRAWWAHQVPTASRPFFRAHKKYVATDFPKEHDHLPFHLICIIYWVTERKAKVSVRHQNWKVKRKGRRLPVKCLSGSVMGVRNSAGDYFLKTRKEGFKKTSLFFHILKLKFQLLFGRKSWTITFLHKKKKTNHATYTTQAVFSSSWPSLRGPLWG